MKIATMPDVIKNCSVCSHACILGKNSVVAHKDMIVESVLVRKLETLCDSCAGITRCKRCHAVVGENNRCPYCCEVVSEEPLPYWLAKYYNDIP